VAVVAQKCDAGFYTMAMPDRIGAVDEHAMSSTRTRFPVLLYWL